MAFDSSTGDLTPRSPHLTGRFLSGPDLTTAVRQLVIAAHGMVTTAAGARIWLPGMDGTGHTLASTATMVAVADPARDDLGMGPCRHARDTGATQRIDDTSTDLRWARWQASAAADGIRSALSTPVTCRDRRLAVLTIYATAPGAFGQVQERALEMLAGVAATLLGAAQTIDRPVHRGTAWEDALGPQELTGLAAGVLAARDRLSPEAARAALEEAAGTQRRGVAEVATAVIDAAVGHEQARRLRATMAAANINRQDLWLHQFSLGGNINEFEIDAYLHHALLLPRFPRDLLTYAANDIMDQIGPPRAPCTAEVLAGLTSSPSNDRQDTGTTRAPHTEEEDKDGSEDPRP